MRDKQCKGDILEFGVYRGRSLIATALLLKEIGSNKKVYGLDSFRGFPSYSHQDDPSLFESLYQLRKIFQKNFDRVKKIMPHRKTMSSTSKLNALNISSSKDFSITPESLIQKK